MCTTPTVEPGWAHSPAEAPAGKGRTSTTRPGQTQLRSGADDLKSDCTGEEKKKKNDFFSLKGAVMGFVIENEV